MPELSTILLFCVAATALVLIPGPATLYIVARGINQGRGAGFASALGIETGSFVHVAAAALGLSALLMSSATAFAVVKYLGAAYLIGLGLYTLLHRSEATAVAAPEPRSHGRIYLQGVVVQVLNPKVALFFLAFLPQFVDPERGSVAAQTLLFGGLLMSIGLSISCVYVLLAGALGAWLRRRAGASPIERYVSGVLYLGLGVSTALVGSGHDR